MIDTFRNEFAFLSNFHIIEFEWRNLRWKSSEHAYQAEKPLNDVWWSKIRNASSPSKAKQYGNDAPKRNDFDNIKDDLMLSILRAKFTVPKMSEKLIATGDKYITEGNTWHDNYWGDCSCGKCVNKPGRNQLGVTLMQIRKELTNT